MVFPVYSAWAATYGRVSNDAVAREAIYNNNVRWIQENNLDGSMGVGPFLDLTQEEFKAEHTGLNVEKPKLTSQVYLGRHSYSGAELPTEIDWSVNGAVTPVKNQGSCGSCWAFSTTGSLEGAAANAGLPLTILSEQQFVDCDKAEDLGCKGGLMDSAFEYVMGLKDAGTGVCSEESYPYTGKDAGTCATDTADCTIAVPASALTGYQDVDPNEDALAEAVALGPVSVAIEADTAVQFYFGGIIKSNFCGAKLDHGVLVVGFGVGEDGTKDAGVKYWKVKNSWGGKWGEDGYMRMKKGKGGKGQCGILTGPPSYPILSVTVNV
jgi:cathepsin L